MGTSPADDKPHVVCVPLPAQGHVTPMMKLAKILHCKGFHVTFVNTEYNHRRLVRSRGPAAVAGLSDFRFATIPDGLPPSDADATQDPASLCYSTMTTCLPHLKKLLEDLNSTAGVPPVTFVLGDNVMSFTVDAAAKVGVPCVLFWTASACGYMGYRNFRFLMDEGLSPLKDEEQLTNGYLDTPVTHAPGMSKHMRLRDFPSFICTTDPSGFLLNFLMHEVEQTDRAAAVILNTLDELEQPALDAMRAILPAKIYTIGPLNSLAEQLLPDGGGPLAAIRPSLWREDRSCLEWLHGREPRSVVYVNYGSITTMSSQELVEFAWGLANCGYDFLWIVRNDLLVKGDEVAAVLPHEFLEATKGRCLLTSWCEQEAVLRHEAVGVFLTHCGWNSTMEGLSAGVPMLCWPFFAEQQTNSRYLCTEWGVGMEVGDDVRREVVEARIRDVMGGEGGREMKRKAVEWSEIGVRAKTQPGGRSLANLESRRGDDAAGPRRRNNRRRRQRRRRAAGPYAVPSDAAAPSDAMAAPVGGGRRDARRRRRARRRARQLPAPSPVASSSRWVPRVPQHMGTVLEMATSSGPLQPAVRDAPLSPSGGGLQSNDGLASVHVCSPAKAVSGAVAAAPDASSSASVIMGVEVHDPLVSVGVAATPSSVPETPLDAVTPDAPAVHADAEIGSPTGSAPVSASGSCASCVPPTPLVDGEATGPVSSLGLLRADCCDSELSDGMSSVFRPAAIGTRSVATAEEWFEVPLTPTSTARPAQPTPTPTDLFLQACGQALPPSLLKAPTWPTPLPLIPRRSCRIAKFCGKEVPGTLSWAQRTVICQLGLADAPEEIDDNALDRYKAFFAGEILEHRLQALRELFSRDGSVDAGLAAHGAQLQAAS